MENKIVRLPKVLEMTGMKRSTLYEKIQKNQFPKPVLLTERCSGWIESEVLEWINILIEKRDLKYKESTNFNQ